MPLVNIHLMQGKPVELRRRVGEIVYRTMMETINVPTKDNFQIITEHDRDSLVYDPEYLGIRMEDVFISLVEVKKENWSFGNGIAQYAE
jgi:hypothetical protein